MEKGTESMKTKIKVNKNYQIIERKITNEKPLSNKVIDMIIPILKKGGNLDD